MNWIDKKHEEIILQCASIVVEIWLIYFRRVISGYMCGGFVLSFSCMVYLCILRYRCNIYFDGCETVLLVLKRGWIICEAGTWKFMKGRVVSQYIKGQLLTTLDNCLSFLSFFYLSRFFFNFVEKKSNWELKKWFNNS